MDLSEIWEKIKPFHSNQITGVGRRKLAQLSAGGDTKQCHGVSPAPSIAPSTSNTESQKVSGRLLVTIICPILHGWCAQPSPLSPNDPNRMVLEVSTPPLALLSFAHAHVAAQHSMPPVCPSTYLFLATRNLLLSTVEEQPRQ